MATATLNKTDRLLTQVLREVREVRFLVEHPSRPVTQRKNTKKLPKWLQASLKEVRRNYRRVAGESHRYRSVLL